MVWSDPTRMEYSCQLGYRVMACHMPFGAHQSGQHSRIQRYCIAGNRGTVVLLYHLHCLRSVETLAARAIASSTVESWPMGRGDQRSGIGLPRSRVCDDLLPDDEDSESDELQLERSDLHVHDYIFAGVLLRQGTSHIRWAGGADQKGC